ncbi:hypothetical protein GGQ68_003341 [Sagittula marina]|uniref:Uncharacterized protein n=1 Tax=Sagittula marina TaxID=943940 RepID=A0A7W6DU85_9RHOB|nr:hypothetical protein [Sagittula marina]
MSADWIGAARLIAGANPVYAMAQWTLRGALR